MAKDLFIDTFALCWRAILIESKNFNSFFNEKNCSENETRDINFDAVENRLAYMYRFGSFNALFVQKCIASFLENYSEAEKVLMRENLKICSLSNGPGFDLVGMLCGIYECSQNLKSLPVLKAVNLYNSWWSVCKNIFCDVFQAASAHSSVSINTPAEIIHFIQSDIYSTLSPDVEESLKDSDVLLMVKVFDSTKATCDVAMKSMKEIFSLLKPGSFVFFIGSKKRTGELTENDFLSRFVTCIHGPVKISVKNLPVDKAIVKTVNIKPKDSGDAYFVVWQKKDALSQEKTQQEEIPQKKKRKKRKKAKSKVQIKSPDITVSEEIKEDIDDNSDISLSSQSNKYSYSSSTSLENISPQSIFPVETNSQNIDKEQSLSQKDLFSLNSIASLLDEIHINSNEENLTEIENIHESRKGNICYLETNIEGGELKKKEVTQSGNQGNLSDEIRNKQTADIEVLTTVSHEQKAQLVEESSCYEKAVMESVSAHCLNKDLNLPQKNVLPIKDYSTCYLDNSNVPRKSSNEENVQGAQILKNLIPSEITNFQKNVQAKKLKIPVTAQTDIICTPSKVKEAKEENKIKEVLCNKGSMNNSSSRKSSIKMLYEANCTLRTVIENMNAKKLEKNLTKVTKEIPVLNQENKDLNYLLNSCENLVTCLEKLTVNLKKSINLSNDQGSRSYMRDSCTKFKVPHDCVNSCYINTVHLNCRKVCNCQIFQNKTYTTCSRHLLVDIKPK